MVEKGELTVPGIDFELDKLHEECGVFGIYSHKDDVALNTYWGLYALQHRGQESTGIVTTDGSNMQVKKGMGLVADVYKDGVGDLTGHIAIQQLVPVWHTILNRCAFILTAVTWLYRITVI